MRYFLLFLFPAVLFSCTNESKNAATSEDSSGVANPEFQGAELHEQEQKMRRERYFVWEVNADQRSIRPNPQLQPDFFHVDTLIAGLNERYPEILLQKRRIENDTLYAEIKNATYLTEQMGSLGAEQYIAEAVINLTSVEGIRYVRIDFKEGSHAAPDVWSRQRFAIYKEQE